MLSSQFLLASFIAAASASNLGTEDTLFASLLKRQEPGTPAYNCHDNCGTAITISKLPNPCDSSAFVTDYNNCLQCAGPDNYNIWRYYGRSLSTVGTTCGLETEPKSGEQEEVGAAVHATSANSSSAAAASTTASSATIGSVSSTGSASAAPVSTTASASASASASAAVSSVVAQTSSVLSGVSSLIANVTASATASAPAQVSTNAAANLGLNDAGIFGAIFVGALFGM